MENNIQKSELMFFYETSYNMPNGDPFTGEQRYDEETKKILVSDVRIKRYIRTYLEEIKKKHIYVSDKTGAGKTDAKGVLKWIAENRNPDEILDIAELLKTHIDVRLFGGISTLGDEAKNIKINGKPMTNGHCQHTGPVQFALLNPSLNEVILRMHQNTTHFKSTEDKQQSSIATSSLVPYSIMQIHGWINPLVAIKTGMTLDDIKLMYEGLWYGTSGEGTSHSRSKIGQNAVLLLDIIYTETKKKVYGVDRLVTIKPKENKKGEQIRSMDDYEFDFSKLIETAKDEKIEKILYYSEIDTINSVFKNKDKFEKIEL